MVTKIYSCPVHGEFEHDIGMNDELKECPKCNAEVKRVFTSTGYSWNTDGFAGSGFSVPSYK